MILSHDFDSFSNLLEKLKTFLRSIFDNTRYIMRLFIPDLSSMANIYSSILMHYRIITKMVPSDSLYFKGDTSAKRFPRKNN